MSEVYEKITSAVRQIRGLTDFVPRVALILGSGLGKFAETIDIKYTVPYGSIDGFPVSTVAGHNGRFIFGYVENVPVVIMQGRVHYYEGYSMTDVVMPVRVMALLGAKTLFLTNASGAINTSFKVGDLMQITDQISDFVPSPLIGQNISELGVRFPDMSHIYTPCVLEAVSRAAERENIKLQKGVYVQLTGPNYESPAEIRMLRTLGADVVGMSTAVEAIAASHMNLRVCGISMVSNMAAGVLDKKLTHEEITEASVKVAPVFERLIRASVAEIAQLP